MLTPEQKARFEAHLKEKVDISKLEQQKELGRNLSKLTPNEINEILFTGELSKCFLTKYPQLEPEDIEELKIIWNNQLGDFFQLN